ncbi:MAG: Hsp20/alpha crystallin family protein [Bacteroidales bacterium]|nr:Hsp20/alpha crystallin family protein [Bacteroidales bacterium]MCF8405052.1 Hsp20/alpha crystallin family protein [Bacteroidales bacterium]
MLPVIKKRSFYPSYNSFLGDNMFSTFFNDGADYTIPAVNIKENENAYTIEVAAPGLNKEDITIKTEKDVLTISSENEKSNESNDEHFTRKEFSFKSFSRSFSIPESVDQEKINAKHKNGVLFVELPKMEEAKVKESRMIKIS